MRIVIIPAWLNWRLLGLMNPVRLRFCARNILAAEINFFVYKFCFIAGACLQANTRCIQAFACEQAPI
jgi:hypothetical protein